VGRRASSAGYQKRPAFTGRFTGIYREPGTPGAFASEDARLSGCGRVDGDRRLGVRAGFIKLSAGDDGLTPSETKILRAAVRAASATGATIGSHTIRGRVVRDQLDIIERQGYTVERFIWIHTQAEPDFDLHLEMAKRGCWIEYENIGWEDAAPHIERIQRGCRVREPIAAEPRYGLVRPGAGTRRRPKALHLSQRGFPA
jgi:phosphotriesterase-related protein